MAIAAVEIKDGCSGCGLCEQICPDVFEVSDVAKVRVGANLADNESQIKEAVESCPVAVIQIS
ncbi:MAG: ferredoxin [Candidatus Margulisiibacteriota bacterium]|jgi:ferredoxin